jgi:hypothetical protein
MIGPPKGNARRARAGAEQRPGNRWTNRYYRKCRRAATRLLHRPIRGRHGFLVEVSCG